ANNKTILALRYINGITTGILAKLPQTANNAEVNRTVLNTHFILIGVISPREPPNYTFLLTISDNHLIAISHALLTFTASNLTSFSLSPHVTSARVLCTTVTRLSFADRTPLPPTMDPGT